MAFHIVAGTLVQCEYVGECRRVALPSPPLIVFEQWPKASKRETRSLSRKRGGVRFWAPGTKVNRPFSHKHSPSIPELPTRLDTARLFYARKGDEVILYLPRDVETTDDHKRMLERALRK